MYKTMKVPLIKLPLKQLFLYGVQIGYIKKSLDQGLKPYLLGFKSKFNIFNLKQAKYQFRSILNVITKLVSCHQKILVVNHYKEVLNLSSLLQIKRCFLLEGHWPGGLLTNYKTIRLYTDYCYKQQPALRKLKSLPALLILLNTTVGNWGLKDGANLNIPVGVITGVSCSGLSRVLYPVATGNDTVEGSLLYAQSIKNAVLRGLIRERLKVISIINK